MPHRPREFWPFDVLPAAERTEYHQQIISFFETAYRLGYRPSRVLDSEILAESEAGGWADLIYRGRERGVARWEVALGEAQAREQAFWTDFPHAAAAALVWLRGGTAADVLAAIEGHLIRGRVILTPTPEPAS